ncbi:protein-disulfide reductase DsbD domain-containing protein [Methylobacter sp. Wu1]|uniref:protein-disulfide reductase DsbD family protein n=1 Tax=Methylobacter sp. Wu1 TaxID=3119359 RepID=UPI002F91E0FC
MLIFRLIPIALLALTCSDADAGPSEAATEQVRAQLIASVDAVRPGDTIQVGVHQTIIPHWHTYWVNPGDSGLATTIDYDLPAGATAGAIQWPTPSRITLGPVVNYGYENEVTLLSSIKVPDDASGVFPVKAKVKWLVCEEICIPQRVELALDLPVVAPGQDRGRGSALIGKAQASLPAASPWPVSATSDNSGLTLRITGTGLQPDNIKDIWFYPLEWGRIAHNADQPWLSSGDAIELKLQPGDDAPAVGGRFNGVLAITEDGRDGPVTRGFIIDVPLAAAKAGASLAAEPDLALPSALFLALLGGVILNLMPCVFPVLSIKALSLIKHAHQAPLQTRLHGLAYTSGVLFSFALLGSLLIALQASGLQIGWGFQFQSPVFVLAVAYLMFAVGLSLSGVFSVGGSATGIGASLAERPGYTGSFFTGMLATVVATPCTAPFMGAAIGFALAQPPLVLLTVFLSLGFGLALPYLLLSFWPFLQRCLPKPGAWMERVKQGMAFPMYAAAVWLVWVLAQQGGNDAVVVALGGMVAIAFAAWLYESTKTGGKTAQHSGEGIAALTLALALTGGYYGVEAGIAAETKSSTAAEGKAWQPYSAERLKALRAEGKPVFLNFTAAWCISCLVNEKVALSQRSVIDTFRQAGITYLKGDWTNRDPEITRKLAEFSRSGVPLYVYYPAGTAAGPVVLPQILTPEIVTQAVTAPASTVSMNDQ